MIIPPFLNSGDAVGITATAKKVDPELLGSGISILKEWGLKPVTGEHIFDRDRFFAGSDKNRLADFQTFLDDPEVKAIFCARGGYGSSRIIDQVRFDSLTDNPKWIIGFSDVTIIHIHINNSGIASLHAPMPAIFHNTSSHSLSRLKKFLMAGLFADISVPHNSNNKTGITEGKIVGGNLSLIVHTLGSPQVIKTADNILLIEEVDEPLYKLDRLMLQMKRAGLFDQLKGLIVGHISNWEDESYMSTAEEVIAEHIEEFSFPVAFDFPFGHEKENYPLPFGMEYRLRVGETGALLNLMEVK